MSVAAEQLFADNRLDHLPAYFEPNVGQASEGLDFFARGPGFALGLDGGEAIWVVMSDGNDSGHVVPMSCVGGAAIATGGGIERGTGLSNYFHGADPAKWRTDVPHYAGVAYEEIYAGIDVVYHGAASRELEYDLRLDAGVDPSTVQLQFTGANDVYLDAAGQLVIETGVGRIVQRRPVAYQEIAGSRQLIESEFVLLGDDRVGFEVAHYDGAAPLVIDPKVVFSTYLGGSQTPGGSPVTGYDTAEGVAVGDDGKIYVTGWTTSANFPTTPGAFDGPPLNGEADVYVVKFNSVANLIDYATFLGGGSNESSSDISVDTAGNVYVTGSTLSHDFPVTAGAFTTTAPDGGNVFVTKLNSSGSALGY